MGIDPGGIGSTHSMVFVHVFSGKSIWVLILVELGALDVLGLIFAFC